MSATQTIEHVLVVPTTLFRDVGYFEGFCESPEAYLETLLDPTYVSYRPRNEVEEDPSFKQLIPYCIFKHAGQIFSYRRSKGQGEGRLHGKRSVGIGGHISSEDQTGGNCVYQEAMWREIQEEVFLETEFRQSCIGLINDDSTPVGQVHLGIVHLFDLDAAKVRPRETTIIEAGFAQPSELARVREEFETWSQICLDYLLR